MIKIPKPQQGEYSPSEMYIKLLPDDSLLLKHLDKNFKRTKKFVLSIPRNKLNYRYAPDKWNIKEILVHIIDDERIYAYRALRIARNDKTPLPGFEQDDYVPYSRANERTLKGIFEEFETVRKATISLFKSFSEEDFLRTGFANNHLVSVKSFGISSCRARIASHEYCKRAIPVK